MPNQTHRWQIAVHQIVPAVVREMDDFRGLGEENPIHYSGAAVLAFNPNDTDAILTMYESEDGVTWTAIAALSAQTIRAKAHLTAHVTSEQEYVGFALATLPAQPVRVTLTQFWPVGEHPAAEAYS